MGAAVSFSSLDTKEQVREAIDIVDLVGKYVQLRRQGRIFVGLCPWHDDTRPSLQVNPERQSFKCWVCDIGGDIFSFVMKMEGVEFREALAMLADQAGIALKPRGRAPTRQPGEPDTSPTRPETPGKRTLYQAMAWAEQKYHECLLTSPEAEPARRYLHERGITEESVRKFHLGFSPNRGDWILQLAQNAKADTKVLEAIGILTRPAGVGDPYDRFRGRLLFSIRDPQDRPVGLGGRLLPGSTSPAKYINSPETPLFSKSNLLYGLDVAHRAIRKNGAAVVVEGYTDCIIAHQYGFDNTVAVLGTALTEKIVNREGEIVRPGHIRPLSRYADRIVLVLDADEAGQRRANEVLELFVAEQVDLQIVTLPEGMDPADFLQEHGAEALRDLLATRAVDAFEHAFQAKTRGVDLDNDIHGTTRALEEMVSIVAKAPRLRADSTRDHRLREEKVLERLAFKFRVPEQEVRDRLTALRRRAGRRAAAGPAGQPPPGAAPESPPAPAIDPWQRELLEILIRDPRCLGQAREAIAPDELASEPCRLIYQACCRLVDAGTEPTFEKLMLQFDDPAIKSLLVELDEQGRAKAAKAPQTLLEELIESFRRREARKRFPAETGALREGRLDEGQQAELLRKIVQQERSRHGISNPTEG